MADSMIFGSDTVTKTGTGTANSAYTVSPNSFQTSQSFNGQSSAPATNFASSQPTAQQIANGAGYNYTPPNTSTPVPTSQITAPSTNLPAAKPTDNGAGVVAGMIATNQPPPETPKSDTSNLDLATTGDYSQDPSVKAAQSTYDKSVTDYSNASLPSSADAFTNAENANGVPDIQKQLADVKMQLADRSAQFQKAIEATRDQPILSIIADRQQAAIQRQQAIEIGALSAKQAALQDNYNLAEQRATTTANLQFQDAQAKIDRMKEFIKLNDDNLTHAEKLAASKISAQAVRLQDQLDQQKTLRTLALSMGVSKPYFNIGGTIVRASDGKGFATEEEAAAAGVDVKNWTNVETVDPSKANDKFQQVGETQTTDEFGNVIKVPVYGFVNAQKGTVTPFGSTVGNGTYQATGNSLTTSNPNPSKVINGYDFTTYATDPNWGNAVNSILPKIPVNYAMSPDAQQKALDSYIQSKAKNSPITGQMIMQAASQYGVDAKVLTAILQQESQFGTAGVGAKTFNPGNVGNVDSGATSNKGDWQSGVNAVAQNMAKRVLNPQVALSAQTGQVDEFTKTLSPEGQQAYMSMSPTQQSNVKQLINGDVLLSDLVASRGVQGSAFRQKLLADAQKVDPNFSENTNKIRYNFQKEWNDANGKAFVNRTTINTALGHTAELKEAVDKLDNTKYLKYNSFKNFLEKEKGNPNIPDFNIILTALAGEMAGLYKGGSPTDQEVSQWRDSIESNYSPQTLNQLISRVNGLAGDRINSLTNEYKKTMGRYPEDSIVQEDSIQKLKDAGVDTSKLEVISLKSQLQPNEVLVKDNSGQIGAIPLSEYDPRKYTKL